MEERNTINLEMEAFQEMNEIKIEIKNLNKCKNCLRDTFQDYCQECEETIKEYSFTGKIKKTLFGASFGICGYSIMFLAGAASDPIAILPSLLAGISLFNLF